MEGRCSPRLLVVEVGFARVIRVRYENGVLKPLDSLEASEGEVLLVKVLRVKLAERVFGSIKVDGGFWKRC